MIPAIESQATVLIGIACSKRGISAEWAVPRSCDETRSHTGSEARSNECQQLSLI